MIAYVSDCIPIRSAFLIQQIIKNILISVLKYFLSAPNQGNKTYHKRGGWWGGGALAIFQVMLEIALHLKM